MNRTALRTWRQKWGLSQAKLSKTLGVSTMAVAYWEWGHRRIPPLLPLALEALEYRFTKGGGDVFADGVFGIQGSE